jgi:hypothetical protein
LDCLYYFIWLPLEELVDNNSLVLVSNKKLQPKLHSFGAELFIMVKDLVQTTFEFDGQSFDATFPENGDADFLTSDDKVVQVDTDQRIVDLFNLKYRIGQTPLTSFQLVAQICSSNREARKWFDTAKTETSEVASLPSVFQDSVNPQMYAEMSTIYQDVGKIRKEVAEERNELAKTQRSQVTALDTKERTAIHERLKGNNLAKVLLIERDRLPMSINCLMAGYGASLSDSNADRSKRRAHARECITRYQLMLLEVTKLNPDLDIDTVINAFVEK